MNDNSALDMLAYKKRSSRQSITGTPSNAQPVNLRLATTYSIAYSPIICNM